jgi:hypothetical protein
MIRIKVQYDAYNRTFKLVDRTFGTFLEDYAVYDLTIPFAVEEIEDHDAFTAIETTIAHA